MATEWGKGWDRESEELFIHDSGARISRTMYRGKMAWWYFPVSLDTSAVEHAPTDEGRADAFATSVKDLSTWKPKPKARTNPAKAKIAAPKDEEGEPKDGPQAADPNPDKEDEDEDDEEKEDEEPAVD